MPTSYYEELTPDGDTLRFRADEATTGPWDARMQHGGPPTALAVAIAARCVAATGREGLHALRAAVEFVGPVPVGEVHLQARIVRAARSAVLAEVRTAAGGRDCLHTRVWFVRDADTASVAAAADRSTGAPTPPTGDEPPMDVEFPYGLSIEWRRVHGAMREPGPAAAWATPRTDLLAGHTWSGLERAVLLGDSASGLSAELDWTRWSFLNVDLDVHLVRPVVGEWLLVDAATQLGAHGSALARSTICDERGVVGSGLQTLVVGELPPR